MFYPCKAWTILGNLHKMEINRWKLRMHVLEAALASKGGGIEGMIARVQFGFATQMLHQFDAGVAVLYAELLKPASYLPLPSPK